MTTETKLDSFTAAYIECALWSSTDTGGRPLDENYDRDDIAPDTLAQMTADCQAFQEANQADIDAAGLSQDRAGHDFWLNRNGHGSGFWDEYFGPDETIREACLRLSVASKGYGSFDLYVGDNGQIYGG
jgi:hypothetical protein